MLTRFRVIHRLRPGELCRAKHLGAVVIVGNRPRPHRCQCRVRDCRERHATIPRPYACTNAASTGLVTADDVLVVMFDGVAYATTWLSASRRMMRASFGSD